MKYKILFIPALLFISMLSPACKHGTNDGIELYRRYAIKNLSIKKVQKTVHHD
ncbi:hypothetical protein SAMN05421827_106109 [Pedobacter terrae]|uniref:Lipoprotein n=1 Tax=Pedobacter terrae TaxID=405671 RepID=A0A1G7U1P7_9SPHI|nr:hypothetical protein [Pedobacter terrae]SDG40720.1 hypothetical protein SAMN05421827_106109 [Pedobacter terrae]